LNLPLSSKIFVVSGPLIPRKSIEVVIQAFIQYFLDHKTPAILCILGEGPEHDSLSSISKGYPNIIFKGQVTNVSDYFRAADLFISASKSEGLPNSVIESLANGTPVLLSNIGPHREILDQRRDAGFIFPHNDPTALALLLKEFLPASLNRTAAWELADKFFSAIRMSKQYQALYLKMVR
jgi:glycosyltransferase involved in cell wall biosynthesis